MQVLAGDIGGTKTLLAICEVSEASERTGAPGIEVLASKRFESGKFPGLGAICRAFADDVARPMPRFAGFGVAGPVANGRSHTTNLPWILDEKDLAQTLGIASVRLANDFHTLALGIQSVHRGNTYFSSSISDGDAVQRRAGIDTESNGKVDGVTPDQSPACEVQRLFQRLVFPQGQHNDGFTIAPRHDQRRAVVADLVQMLFQVLP